MLDPEGPFVQRRIRQVRYSVSLPGLSSVVSAPVFMSDHDSSSSAEASPDEHRLERLAKKARQLPKKPGVYLMKDAAGVVLYVGKATTLPDRVSSYFVPSADLEPKKQPLLEMVHDFDVLTRSSFSECELLSSRKPRSHSVQTAPRSSGLTSRGGHPVDRSFGGPFH